MRTGSSWQVVGYECQPGLVGLDIRDPRCKFNLIHAYSGGRASITLQTVRSVFSKLSDVTATYIGEVDIMRSVPEMPAWMFIYAQRYGFPCV